MVLITKAMDNNQILSAARNKVSRLLKTPEMGVGFFNDCRYMIECGETNAYYGYEVDMLLTNRTASTSNRTSQKNKPCKLPRVIQMVTTL